MHADLYLTLTLDVTVPYWLEPEHVERIIAHGSDGNPTVALTDEAKDKLLAFLHANQENIEYHVAARTFAFSETSFEDATLLFDDEDEEAELYAHLGLDFESGEEAEQT